MPNGSSKEFKPTIDGSVSQGVAEFYDRHGWVDQGTGSSGEDNLFRRFPSGHEQYSAGVTRRIAQVVGDRRGALLFAGCGDMPDNHSALTHGFTDVTCMDISETALRIAERKLGPAATYRRESIVTCGLPENLFDVAFCAHVIYHIDKHEQEAAVRQLIRLAKPGGRVIIIYANPRSIFTIPGEAMRWVKRRTGAGRGNGESPALYYHAHPLGWWRRFSAGADISFVPWEVIGSRPARALLRGDGMAKLFYRSAAWFETKVPKAAARLWQYPIVILDNKTTSTTRVD